MAESNHVDSYSVQLLASRGDPGDDDDLLLGDRVLITKGKYSGKEGYLCSIGDDVVFVSDKNWPFCEARSPTVLPIGAPRK